MRVVTKMLCTLKLQYKFCACQMDALMWQKSLRGGGFWGAGGGGEGKREAGGLHLCRQVQLVEEICTAPFF